MCWNLCCCSCGSRRCRCCRCSCIGHCSVASCCCHIAHHYKFIHTNSNDDIKTSDNWQKLMQLYVEYMYLLHGQMKHLQPPFDFLDFLDFFDFFLHPPGHAGYWEMYLREPPDDDWTFKFIFKYDENWKEKFAKY